MAWIVLVVAGLLEAVWATALSASAGLTQPVPSAVFAVATVLSVVGLGWSMRHIPTATAYAIWTGIGAVGTALLGMYLFGEARDAARLACIALIVSGIVGLKLVSPE